MTDDLISRQAAIDALKQQVEEMTHWSERYAEQKKGILTAINIVSDLPSVQPKRKYTLEEVAEILASVIGDECACNINGIDEWLPECCKYAEIGEECPNPKEKHGCWIQFLLQGGAQI